MKGIKIERIVRRRPVLSRPPEFTNEVYWLVTGNGLPRRGLLFGTREEAETAAKLDWKDKRRNAR
jgi:hypothetical protein